MEPVQSRRFKTRAMLLAAAALTVGALSLLPGVSGVYAQSPEAVMNYNQGIDAYNQGNANKAMALFEKAVLLDATYTDAYYNLGSIYYQKGMYTKAEAAFRKSANLAPRDYQAKYNLALALDKLNRQQEALPLLMEIPPNDRKYVQARQKVSQIQGVLAAQEQAAKAKATQPQPTNTTPGTPVNVDSAKVSVKPFSKGFFGPTGMTLDPEGYLYVANYSKNLVYKVSATGDKTLFAKSDLLGGPIGLTFNPKTQDMYVANYLKNTVSKISPKGDVTTIASGLSKPYNLFLDTYNNVLYVGEQETNAISKIELPQ